MPSAGPLPAPGQSQVHSASLVERYGQAPIQRLVKSPKELTALVGESYARAYKTLVKVQQLCELLDCIVELRIVFTSCCEPYLRLC